MQELLTSIAQGLVEDPASVTVTVDEPNENGVTVYHLHVAADDMGSVSATPTSTETAMPIQKGCSFVA